MVHDPALWKNLEICGIRDLLKIRWKFDYEIGPHILSFSLQPMDVLSSYQQKTGASLSEQVDSSPKQ